MKGPGNFKNLNPSPKNVMLLTEKENASFFPGLCKNKFIRNFKSWDIFLKNI